MQTLSIAPCGMNCSTCLAYLRTKNTCGGCRESDEAIWPSCLKCIVRSCEHLEKTESKFCYECQKFPCRRIKQLDKRYRTRYHVSFIENLLIIKNNGLEKFIQTETEKWRCPSCGGTICVHRWGCLKCKTATHVRPTEPHKAD